MNIFNAPNPRTYIKGKGLVKESASLLREWFAGVLWLSFLRLAPTWMIKELVTQAYQTWNADKV